jgi:ribose/xylose/arabinose/galactoside ABC-type transport system permease subunit
MSELHRPVEQRKAGIHRKNCFNSVEGDIGETLALPAIAAVLIGGLFGAGTVFAIFVGALILTPVLSGMNLLAVNANGSRW